jgi:prevent-host-death family protein
VQTIGAFEAKTHFSALLQKVEQGEHVIITKHGHPVAKMIPTNAVSHTQVKSAIDAIKTFRKRLSLGKFNWKDLRDEGRRY